MTADIPRLLLHPDRLTVTRIADYTGRLADDLHNRFPEIPFAEIDSDLSEIDRIDAAQRHQVLLLAPELDLLPMALALSLLERGYDLFIPIPASTRLDAPGLARLKAAGVLFVDESSVLGELAFTSSNKTDRDVER